MARICIITPGQLGMNPRTVKEAAALTAAGHDVTVVATRLSDAIEPRDQAVLATAGWRTIRVNFTSQGRRLGDRLLQIVAQRAHRYSGARLFAAPAHSALTRRLSRVARRVPADLYIAHYVAALPAAAAAAAAHGAPFAYDAEDFHAGDLPDTVANRPSRATVMAIEGQFLRRAAYITAASPLIARAYAETYAIAEPQVVLNVFPLANAPPPPAPVRPGELPSVYWFSQNIGADRGLQSALVALGLTRNRWSLHLRGVITPAFERELRDFAAAQGVADRLTLLPPATPDEMETLAAHHTLGLAAETGHTPNNLLALSNKQFSYILAGLPILLSDTPAHQAFARDTPGVTFLFRANDAQSLADRIDALLGDLGQLNAARDCTYRLGQDRFNWDMEQHKLVAIVQASLATP